MKWYLLFFLLFVVTVCYPQNPANLIEKRLNLLEEAKKSDSLQIHISKLEQKVDFYSNRYSDLQAHFETDVDRIIVVWSFVMAILFGFLGLAGVSWFRDRVNKIKRELEESLMKELEKVKGNISVIDKASRERDAELYDEVADLEIPNLLYEGEINFVFARIKSLYFYLKIYELDVKSDGTDKDLLLQSIGSLTSIIKNSINNIIENLDKHLYVSEQEVHSEDVMVEFLWTYLPMLKKSAPFLPKFYSENLDQLTYDLEKSAYKLESRIDNLFRKNKDN